MSYVDARDDPGRTSVSSNVGGFGSHATGTSMPGGWNGGVPGGPTTGPASTNMGNVGGVTSHSGQGPSFGGGSGFQGGSGNINSGSGGSPGGTQNQGGQNFGGGQNAAQTASGFQGAQGLGGGAGFQGAQFGRGGLSDLGSAVSRDPGVGGVPGGITGRGTDSLGGLGNHPAPGNLGPFGSDPTNLDSGRRRGATPGGYEGYSPGDFDPNPFGNWQANNPWDQPKAKITDRLDEEFSGYDPFPTAADQFMTGVPTSAFPGITGIDQKDFYDQLAEEGPLSSPYDRGIMESNETMRELQRELLNRNFPPAAAPEPAWSPPTGYQNPARAFPTPPDMALQEPAYEPPTGYQNPARAFPQRRTGKIQDQLPQPGLGPGRTATPNVDLSNLVGQVPEAPAYGQDYPASRLLDAPPSPDMARRQITPGGGMLDAMAGAQDEQARQQAIAEEASRRQALADQEAFERNTYNPEKAAQAALGPQIAGLPDAYPPDYPASRLNEPGEIEMPPEPLPPEPQVATAIPRPKPFRPDVPTIDVPELPEPKPMEPMPTEIKKVAQDPVVKQAQQILAGRAQRGFPDEERGNEHEERIIREAQRRVKQAIKDAEKKKDRSMNFGQIAYNPPGTAPQNTSKKKKDQPIDFGTVDYGPVPSDLDLEQAGANPQGSKGKKRRYPPIGFSNIAYA